MNTTPRELRFALLLDAITQLRTAGSWCGETHLQKSIFALEYLFSTPLDYEFIMYRHGPFSFDLRDEIAGLRGAQLIELEMQEGYGPRLKPSSLSQIILDRNRIELKKVAKPLKFVTEWFGGKDVKELEKLATALFVNVNEPDRSFPEKAQRIRELKPHIALNDAERTLHLADQKLVEAKRVKS